MSQKPEVKGRADHIDKLVSRRLKIRRMMLGLSQADLGKAVTVSIQQVQKYEKGTNRISSGKLFAFAKFLKVPISYFYNQTEDTSNIIGGIFAEEGQSYAHENSENGYNDLDREASSEKEIVTLIKAFHDIRSAQTRRKFIELVKTIS